MFDRNTNLFSLSVIIAIVTFSLLSSCAILDNQNSYTPPVGYIYQSNSLNVMMSPNSEIGSRTGVACVESWAGLVSTGEAGIKQAAAAGAILTVKAVDYQITRILGIGYVKICTIAYGD
ncbi:MAG: hypothetical protein H3C43_04415 [Leptonema sp. (in: Bacteria)]|nr:hypothetical protein [Leptonema sp. (in: bacteria)]